NIYGYVRKANTIPDNGSSLKNKNSAYKNQSRSFKALKDVFVYDNTSGELVPYGIIDKGQSYPIATDYGNWWRIVFADRVGYVRKSDVESEFLKSDKYFRAEGNIPIYDNRSGSLKKVGELKKGQIYPRVSDYGNWHRIQFGDIYGYVRKSDTSVASGSSIKNMNKNYKNQSRTFTALETTTVYDNTSGKLVPFGTIDKGATFPIATDYGNWWRVIYADRVGYVRKGEVRAASSSTDKFFQASQNTEVFDNRTGELVKVGEIYKGESYPIVSNYGNWWRVQFGDIYGYVRKSHTGYATGKEIKNVNSNYKNSNNKFIANKKVTIYDNSSGKLVPFGTIEKGTVYPIASDYGNWWRIIYLDRVGYVRKTEVDLYGMSYTNYNLTLNKAVDIQKDPERNPKVWASHAFVYTGYIDKNNRVTANSLDVRNKPNSSDKDSKVIDKLAKGTKVEILGEMNNWYAIKTDKVQEVTALPDQIRYYLDPKNFMYDPKQKFQFLVLSKPSGASVTVLNNYLKGKGSLSGQGSAFYNAARNHGINDVYLLSHAIHETGHGSSTLANGVEVGINNKGDLEVVTAQNRSQLTAIKKTYNMFGIGAVDTNPLHGGAKTAYANGWFTPALAIDGGAKWISNGYIQNRFKQDTLYKMKWNPQMKDGNAWKQYATDVAWASKQVNAIYNLYQELGITDSLEFDYPSYN
ncbi:SH3 domain-containing protein, partial [Pseudogracilibacillus auburnensis]|uniref:SH3 domain-containing protein n=1 Tax=Pseudogracilibacillus auburnensis TaxID=1494959 RepID=UPI001A96CFAD